MDHRRTPPYSAPNTPDMGKDPLLAPAQSMPSPHSISGVPFTTPTLNIPPHLDQELVDLSPELKRYQQDLLILTGFSDNSTLHWRPSWFDQAAEFTGRFWTLHNPPNVVTEVLPYRTPQMEDRSGGYLSRLPLRSLGRPIATRRMRRPEDPPALYIKNWEHWDRYCEMYGIPTDFLCEEQVTLMRLGWPRSNNGQLIMPPTYPLYPEPQPLGRGRYVLSQETYRNLPPMFQNLDKYEVIIVHSDGKLEVIHSEGTYFLDSQWTHYDGRGRYTHDWWYDADPDALKVQGAGRRWSYLSWTKEQELSCRPPKLRLILSESSKNKKSVSGAVKKKKKKATRHTSVAASKKSSKAQKKVKLETPRRPEEHLDRAHDSDSGKNEDMEMVDQNDVEENHAVADYGEDR